MNPLRILNKKIKKQNKIEIHFKVKSTIYIYGSWNLSSKPEKGKKEIAKGIKTKL